MSIGDRSVTEAAGSVNRMGEYLVSVALLNSRFVKLFLNKADL